MKQNIELYPNTKQVRIESKWGCGITIDYIKAVFKHPNKLELTIEFDELDIVKEPIESMGFPDDKLGARDF
jgi:hypothetical protein